MILFVGSNPSHLNNNPYVAFEGSKSEPTFKKWAKRVCGRKRYSVINVSDEVTPHNRPLRKGEIDLVDLCSKIIDSKATKIIALGNTAEIGLKMAQKVLGEFEYFKLPHPSPLNRKLNNWHYVEAVLDECTKFVRKNES